MQNGADERTPAGIGHPWPPPCSPFRVRNKTWLISDTHFGHQNIIKFAQRPESHEVIMLSNWIDRIGETDDVLHLGDVFLGKQGSPLRWAKVIARLPGRKYLILGNHDKAKTSLYTEIAGFKIIPPFIHRGLAFSHRPITPEFPLHAPKGARAHTLAASVLDAGAGWHTNIHGHIHGNTITEAAERHGEQGPMPGKNYINVSVEVHDLAPIQLGSIAPFREAC